MQTWCSLNSCSLNIDIDWPGLGLLREILAMFLHFLLESSGPNDSGYSRYIYEVCE